MEKISDVRKYEEEKEKLINIEERPDFHLSPRTGWMNDPNGFSIYNNKYHLFYQYHPYDTFWGPMHWGHAVSDDMIKWNYLPAAIVPDSDFDNGGCFSGSAIELSDGRQLIMYTGISKELQSDGLYKDIQQQCIAVGDGVDYKKYEENPVISYKKLPEGNNKFDFRDPKIWQCSDKTYRCIVAASDHNNDGEILLYKSDDAINWEFVKVIIKNDQRFGKIWECPDFFELDGKQVLLTSPIEMLSEEYRYHSGNGTLCFIGNYDGDTDAFFPKVDCTIDHGIDFYAPQTLETKDGRRIMIGWMQNWDTCNSHSKDAKWFGQMTIPRELGVKNGKLIQNPIREIDNYHKNKIEYENIKIDSRKTSLSGIKGRKVDIYLEIKLTSLSEKFVMSFAANDKFHTDFIYDSRDNIIKVDREFSGLRKAILHSRYFKVFENNSILKVRMILDKYSAEIFINEGDYAITTTIYTEQKADEIYFKAVGEFNINILKYDIKV